MCVAALLMQSMISESPKVLHFQDVNLEIQIGCSRHNSGDFASESIQARSGPNAIAAMKNTDIRDTLPEHR